MVGVVLQGDRVEFDSSIKITCLPRLEPLCMTPLRLLLRRQVLFAQVLVNGLGVHRLPSLRVASHLQLLILIWVLLILCPRLLLFS